MHNLIDCQFQRSKELIPLKDKSQVIAFLIGLMMMGCVVYHPQTLDVVLISAKNDLKIDAGISLLPSLHSTISYGLTDKVAIQGFGSYGYDNRYYFQAATGLYKEIKQSRVLELYGGYGYGYGYAYKDPNPGSLDGNYQQIFAQLNYGKVSTESSNFEAGVGFKLGYFHSKLNDVNYYSLSYPGPYDVYIDESILLEPIGFVRVGGDHTKFNVKLGGAFIYKFSNREKHLPYMYLNLGLGLQYIC